MTNFFMRLDLFGDGGAGAPAGAGAAPAGAGENAGTTPTGKTGAKVIYGKQEPAEPASTETPAAGEAKSTETSPEDKRKAFSELIKGEYKDIYAQEVQQIINRRFKETRELEEANAKSRPVLDMLMQRYGIEDGDVSRLQEALENDDVYWEDAADHAGMTVDQYKKYQKLQRQNAELIRAQQEQQGREEAYKTAQRWQQEAEELKQIYPNLDLNEEIQNKQFVDLLRAGIPLRHAYEVTHLDTIVGNVAQTTAAQTEKSVTDNIRARGMRPKENGQTSQAAFTVKSDVRQLSRKDREEIARRVAMGEHIAF